ncbi:MAG: Hsp20 family protein [Candidatus Thiodiazotropha sp.]|jgi:HSP20 family molecular chaperone IbpA
MKVFLLISAVLLLAFSSSALAQPPGAGPEQRFGYHSPSSSRFTVQQGMRFERFRDRNGYQLRIHTRGMDPEAIQVRVQGRSLVVENRESHQIEQRNDRGSYQFAATSSNMRRRFPIPPDADPGAMQRSLEEGAVVITLPYAQGPRY